jgi:hypothetical protein
MVMAFQSELASFLDWIDNTHLRLCGLSEVIVKRKFSLPRDISAKETRQAEEINLRNIKTKIDLEFIDKDTGKREAGYE